MIEPELIVLAVIEAAVILVALVIVVWLIRHD
jgi:hypothetical protein